MNLIEPMVSLFGKLARMTGLYSYLRYTLIYEVVQRLRNPAHSKQLDIEEHFYRGLLSGLDIGLIFDVGANVGDKAEVFSRIAQRVVCFEPDPRLAEHLRRRFRNQPKVVVEQCGISNHEGWAELHAYDGGSAYNTFNERQHERVVGSHREHQLIRVPLVTLDKMMARYGRPVYLKVDVEGHEREVFEGLSQPVSFVSFEANLPEFASETCESARRLIQISGDAVRFAVYGPGFPVSEEFSMDVDGLCSHVMGQDAPPYLEIFARCSSVVQASA
jgi:FkbM family methyltransferase